MTKSWTEERRKRQSEAIKRHKPWLKSTGPRTRKGKQRSSLNSLRHGTRGKSAKHVRKVLRINREFIKYMELYYMQNALEMRMTSELIKNRLKSKGTPHPGGNPVKRTDDPSGRRNRII